MNLGTHLLPHSRTAAGRYRPRPPGGRRAITDYARPWGASHSRFGTYPRWYRRLRTICAAFRLEAALSVTLSSRSTHHDARPLPLLGPAAQPVRLRGGLHAAAGPARFRQVS